MEEGLFVVKHQNAIEVFLNDNGTITIHQINWPDDDSFVSVGAENAVALANALIDARNELSGAKNA